MPVMNSLTLDHFYIALDDEKFGRYSKFIEELNGRYSKVVSGQDSWEGYYTPSRIGDYFEILKNRRTNGLGIGLSPQSPVFVVAKNIVHEMPHLKLNVGARLDSQNKPWFDWISPVAYEDHENLIFNVWIMDFHKTHIDYVARPIVRYIDSWDSLTGTIGRHHLPEFEKASVILPGTKKIDDAVIKYSVPRRDGYDLEIILKIVEGDQKFIPEEVTFSLYDKSNFKGKLEQYPFVKHLTNNIYSLKF